MLSLEPFTIASFRFCPKPELIDSEKFFDLLIGVRRNQAHSQHGFAVHGLHLLRGFFENGIDLRQLLLGQSEIIFEMIAKAFVDSTVLGRAADETNRRSFAIIET